MEQYLPMREIITNDEKDGIWDLFLNTYTYIKKNDMWTTITNKHPQEKNSFMLFGIPVWKEEPLEYYDSDGEEMVPFYADDDGNKQNDDPVVVNYPQIPLVRAAVIPRFYDLRTKITIGGRRGHHRGVIKAIGELSEDDFMKHIQEQFDAQLKQWWLEMLDRQEYFEDTFTITERTETPPPVKVYNWEPWSDYENEYNYILEQTAEREDFYSTTTYEQYYRQGRAEFASLLAQYPEGYETARLPILAENLEGERESYQMIQDEIDKEMRKINGIDEREEDEEVNEWLIHDLEQDLKYIQSEINLYIGTPQYEGAIETATKHQNYSPLKTDEFGVIQGKYLQDKYDKFVLHYSKQAYANYGRLVEEGREEEIRTIKKWFDTWDEIMSDTYNKLQDFPRLVPSQWTGFDQPSDLKAGLIGMINDTRYDMEATEQLKAKSNEFLQLVSDDNWKMKIASNYRAKIDNFDSKFSAALPKLYVSWMVDKRIKDLQTWVLKRFRQALNKRKKDQKMVGGSETPPIEGGSKTPPTKERGRPKTRGKGGRRSGSGSRSGSVQLRINTMRNPKTGRAQFPSSSPKTSPPPGLRGEKLPPEGGGSSSTSSGVQQQEENNINIRF
jgi:hypothetical protein